VIMKLLMGPFLLKHSLLELGLSTITDDIRFDEQSTKCQTFKKANWPLVRCQEPAVASRQSQFITYGEDQFKVSIFIIYSRKLDVFDFWQ
jgi:hypothetical protein